VPDEDERRQVHRVIYQELCFGKINVESRDLYRTIMSRLVKRGAEAIILGCTEISLLVSQHDAAVPLFDTTDIHARYAAEHALQ
jgi:aspartate racemase